MSIKWQRISYKFMHVPTNIFFAAKQVREHLLVPGLEIQNPFGGDC